MHVDSPIIAVDGLVIELSQASVLDEGYTMFRCALLTQWSPQSPGKRKRKQ